METNGVNGVTQCPIAPDDTFTYEFRALQTHNYLWAVVSSL
ncbi:hypothetical protein FVEG_11446 [Fusarium verticillioides 7600]|uniref:Plastocyanin-like domain-containing protein n=1 Tax=Gibberella moniliformis (strain M3125 / FGSC 7600) TaxID=334819 RepID=W7MP27_GIBM7|nr:hypothetical protein FVEG_11446 [Fusarium verticillioides 7600]EWG52836.1 hypothetical protein FVEG_11446 [Fusarium verticillioides 7600]